MTLKYFEYMYEFTRLVPSDYEFPAQRHRVWLPHSTHKKEEL